MGHSQPSLNPTGGDALRRGATQPALHDELMARGVDRANMQRAWKRVQANRGGGVRQRRDAHQGLHRVRTFALDYDPRSLV